MMACRPPPLWNALRAGSTSSATSVGSGATVSMPAPMRPGSSRSLIRPCMRSACSPMMRKNSRRSAGSTALPPSSSVVTEPLMEVSGVRSSWPTRLKNSARWRSISSSGAKSCMVTTTDSISPSGDRIGVALISVRTLRPSGTASSISSARTISPLSSRCAVGNSPRGISRPSARRQEITSSNCSVERPGPRRPSTIRRAARLIVNGRPLPASKTTTPTGEVSTRASKRALACRSLRWARALATAAAAWEANSISTSSSSAVKASSSAFSARKKLPRCTSRWRSGAAWKARENIGVGSRPSERM